MTGNLTKSKSLQSREGKQNKNPKQTKEELVLQETLVAVIK